MVHGATTVLALWAQGQHGAARPASESAGTRSAFAAPAGAWLSPKLLGVLERDEWDVAVVGGGPAGLAAASAAAAAGARTIVLERAEHPRYKTCGGGLIGASVPPRAA